MAGCFISVTKTIELQHPRILLTSKQLSHTYQLEEPISDLRVVCSVDYFHNYLHLNRTFCGAISEIMIRRRVLWRLIWVGTF